MGEGKGEGKYGSVRGDNEAQMDFIVASSDSPPTVLLDFRRMVDHLHLSPTEARAMAEGLEAAAREAEQGVILRVQPRHHRAV